MEAKDVVAGWGRILRGYRPNLSIEITRECPLRCPGCYAYGDTHLGGDVVLRQRGGAGYRREFTNFGAAQPKVKRLWFSLSTPQKGEDSPERLRPEDRQQVVSELSELHRREPKLVDMTSEILEGYLNPPASP